MNRIGFACKVIGDNFFSMRSCSLRNANLENLVGISNYNLNYLEKMITYCSEKQISLVRIGSDIIPFASHPHVNFNWKELFEERIKKIGGLIKYLGLRVSMHPGQYTVLNSINEYVVEQSLRDIIWHNEFLNTLGTDYSSKIILHIGGIYNDKASSICRFIKNFKQLLGKDIKLRIVLENDDKNYNIEDVITVSSELNIPIVLDIFHHQLLQPETDVHDNLYWINKAGKTWKSIDGRQKIHYSQQNNNGIKGSHSETININEFMNFYKTISHLDLDIMLEVKDKNLSVLKCMKAIKNSIQNKDNTKIYF